MIGKLSSPSILHQFLEENGLKAQKRSSQNFLIDGNIIRKIVSAAAVSDNDVILEIGPGPGALTQALLETGSRVIAIEIDRGFSTALTRLQTADNRLTIINKDFLSLCWERDILPLLKENKKIKVVANLPYHITTLILAQLLQKQSTIDTITVMIQKEVAERFVAKEGTKEYGSFTVFIQHFAKAEYAFTVEPTCFFPRPKVRSAVVCFSMKKNEIIPETEQFLLLVRQAFSQRRKMLKVSLRTSFSLETLEKASASSGVSLTLRPESLSRSKFLSLHLAILSHSKASPP